MKRITAHTHTHLSVDANLDIDHEWLTTLDDPSEHESLNDHLRIRLGSGFSLGGKWQDIVSLAEALSAYVTDEADRRDTERTARKAALARILARRVVMDGAA